MKQLVVWTALCAVTPMVLGCEIGVEQPAAPAAAKSDTGWKPGDQPSARVSHVARGHLQFVEGYQQGYAVAARERKPLMLFFTARWCQFCHQMADEAFTHPQVVRLSGQFVCVLIDADLEPDVCRQFSVGNYPTIQFLSPRGVPLERVVGKQPGHQIMMAMQSALQHVARRFDASEATVH